MRAWSRQPIICRAKPKSGSSYTCVESRGSPSPIEIKGNERFSCVRAWSRQPIICRAKPKWGSSYSCIESRGSPSPIEIEGNERFSCVRAWSRQPRICRAKPKWVSSYTCIESRGILFRTPFVPPAAPGHYGLQTYCAHFRKKINFKLICKD